jgi:hypothetical protein
MVSLVFLTYLVVNTTADATVGVLTDQSYLTNGLNSMKIFDGGVLFILIIAGVVAILFSLLIEPHPILLIVGIIMIFISVFFSMQLSNAFYDIQANPVFADVTPEFSISIWTMQHLPYLIMVIGILLVLAMIYKYGER